MQNLADTRTAPSRSTNSDSINVTVVIPTRNEARHLARCLDAVRRFSEVYVVDSHSTDSTVEIARAFGAEVVQFDYHGGWPKKRQWALDSLPFENDWVLLLDADEVLTPDLADEIGEAIRDPQSQWVLGFPSDQFSWERTSLWRKRFLEVVSLPARQRTLRVPLERSRSLDE